MKVLLYSLREKSYLIAGPIIKNSSIHSGTKESSAVPPGLRLQAGVISDKPGNVTLAAITGAAVDDYLDSPSKSLLRLAGEFDPACSRWHGKGFHLVIPSH